MTRDEAILKLQNDIKIRRYGSNTLIRYVYIVSRFLDYIGDNKPINELNENDAIKYLNTLTNERYYKSSSYNNVNSILKFFLEVTLDKDIGYRRMPNAKVEIRKKAVPEKWIILYIIYHAPNIKHKCWFSLAYGSGLRTYEIARLRVKDIDSINMKINTIGKGNKERITILSKTTLVYLRDYIRPTKIRDKEEYLFPGQKGKHICEASISKAFNNVLEKIGLNEEGITIHSLRRSFASHLLRMGVDLQTVKELMGHNSITTTSCYSQIVYLEKQIKNPLDGEFL